MNVWPSAGGLVEQVHKGHVAIFGQGRIDISLEQSGCCVFVSR